MAKGTSILGDIRPKPDKELRRPSSENAGDDTEDTSPMDGGSGHGSSHHPGSREMTEGSTGGVDTEVGGTRNFRQGSGASGGDIGNRPE